MLTGETQTPKKLLRQVNLTTSSNSISRSLAMSACDQSFFWQIFLLPKRLDSKPRFCRQRNPFAVTRHVAFPSVCHSMLFGCMDAVWHRGTGGQALCGDSAPFVTPPLSWQPSITCFALLTALSLANADFSQYVMRSNRRSHRLHDPASFGNHRTVGHLVGKRA